MLSLLGAAPARSSPMHTADCRRWLSLRALLTAVASKGQRTVCRDESTSVYHERSRPATPALIGLTADSDIAVVACSRVVRG